MAPIQPQVMAGKGIPMFDGTNFAHWKLKAEWHLEGLHHEMLRVLREGPIIPGRMIEAVLDAEGNEVTAALFVASQVSAWTNLDKTLYNLDSRAKSTIGNALIEPIFVKISACKTAKAIWDFLITQYEGVTIVKSQRRKILIRAYENFFSLPNESLSDIHTRLQILINDLERVGVIKSNGEVCDKFCSVIPDHFSEVITSINIQDKMDDYDLPGLFGIMLNFEESKELKRLNTLRIAKDPEAALVVTTRRNRELYHRADYTLPKVESSDGEDEDDDEETVAIKNELAFLAKKLEKKKLGGYKGKNTFNPKTAKCYRCGIT